MAKVNKSQKMEKARRGTLMLLALFLMGSAVVRIALEAAPAIAREVAEIKAGESRAGARIGSRFGRNASHAYSFQEARGQFG